MAIKPSDSGDVSAKHITRRPPPFKGFLHLQAYFVARETLRRLMHARTPCVPPDPNFRRVNAP